MKLIAYSLAVAGMLALVDVASADHDKACKNIHGQVTVVTTEGVSVNDKLYAVGRSTRITKGDQTVKLSQVSAGDIVCLDIRGKDDIEGEVAAITVLSASDSAPIIREKEFVREKTVRPASHDKTCKHVHGKIVRIDDSTLIVEGKPYACQKTTRIIKGDHAVALETLKAGDFVCLDATDDEDAEHKITAVTVLSPADASQFESREIIREREKIKEKIREDK